MGHFREYELSSSVCEQLRSPRGLLERFREGEPVWKIVGFSQETMAKFYQVAYRLFVEGKYPQSSSAFLFLTALAPENFDHWLGLGMSMQMMRHTNEAIDAYEVAALIEIENPVPYFFLAKCFFSIHDRRSALEALDMALEYAGDSLHYLELKRQAESAKKMILEELE